MYSHGSSARIGVGKRGHGGRNYRPPKPRNNDPSVLVPPPLKACDCMVQLDIAEYAEVAQDIQGQRRRLHSCFPGNSLNERKKSLTDTEKVLRSGYGVHLVVPGRNQKGPLAVVGKSIRETLPAVDCLMQRLVLVNGNGSISALNAADSSSQRFLIGRIMRNVKDPNDVVLLGRFLQQKNNPFPRSADENVNDSKIHLQPYWLFESDSWSAMVCPLRLTRSEIDNTASETNSKVAKPNGVLEEEQNAIAEALQIGFDNLRFRLGNASLSELEIFLTASQEKAFAIGDPSKSCIQALYREIRQTEVALQKPVSAEY